MILKELMPNLLQMRPSITDLSTLRIWRSLVILEIEKSKKFSANALSIVREKFLKPQEWYGTVKPVIKGTNIQAEDEILIDGWANVTDPDRSREIILSSAWNTSNFDNNPIMLFNHNHNWPIGIVQEYKIEDKGFYYRGSIGNPSAYPVLTDVQIMVRSLLAQGILKASSVGFIPIDLEYDEANDIIRYTDVELLEISLVSVPMQQGSLLDSVGPAAKQIINTIDKGTKAMDKAQYDEMMAKLQAISDACTALNERMGKVEEAFPPKKDPDKEDPKKDEEIKSLKSKVATVEKELSDVKAEKAELEKEGKELIDSLKKQGINIE